MKSTRGIQQDDVWAAADALVAAGLRPTIERVRQAMGRGSPNTVTPMLEAWFAGLAPRLGILGNDEAGQAAPTSLRKALDAVWTVALANAAAQAEKKLDEHREILNTERLEVARAREELATLQKAAAQRETDINESLSLAKSQLSEASLRQAQMEASLERSEQDALAARQALVKLIQEHASERRAQSEQVQIQISQLHTAQERAISTERRLLQEIDRARLEAKQSGRDLAEARSANEKAQTTLLQMKAALNATNEKALLELTSLREQLIASDQRAVDMRLTMETTLRSTSVSVNKRSRLSKKETPIRASKQQRQTAGSKIPNL